MSYNQSLPFLPETPWLAPIAGWSDLPFRLLCREHGAAVCYTEMISAKGLIYNNPGTENLLKTIPEDNPLIVQLCGSEASCMKDALTILLEKGYKWFDCNMGCSVPKITRTGSGASMMRNIDNAIKVAEAMIHTVNKKSIGFKLRLGWDEKHETWPTLAKLLEEAGAGWITLHPRTAQQGFTGTANWEKLLELKQQVKIPIIASGDLLTASDGVDCIKKTHVDTIMYARGALKDPNIFTKHNQVLKGKQINITNSNSLFSMIMRHSYLACKYSSYDTALLKMRTIVPRYIHHLKGAKQLRLNIINCRTWSSFEDILQQFLKKNKYHSCNEY